MVTGEFKIYFAACRLEDVHGLWLNLHQTTINSHSCTFVPAASLVPMTNWKEDCSWFGSTAFPNFQSWLLTVSHNM